MDKLRAMQTPSWFLQLLSRSSVFTRCKVRKYLWPACFGPCLFFLSSPFPVTFLPCFPWAPCKPLWLTTALKSNTVQSVPEEGGTPGVAAALGNFAPYSFLRRCWMRREHRHEEKPHGREMGEFHRPGVRTAA